MKLRYWLIILLFCMVFSTVGIAGSEELIIFTQNNDNVKTLYLSMNDGNLLKPISSGKKIDIFTEANHLLYFVDHQLFEYDFQSQKGQLIAELKDDAIYVQFFLGETDQAFVISRSEYQIQYYVLDFTDHQLRRVPRPKNSNNGSSEGKKISYDSPDGLKRANVKYVSKGRFEITVEQINDSKYKTIWDSPKEMVVLPELPVWSPDSARIAFFGRKFTGYEGFYSLYIFDVNDRTFKTVQEQVLFKDFFDQLSSGGFKPNWSGDSKYLLYGYLPYGSPTQNAIIKYEIGSDKKEILVNTPGANLFPRWSPSGERVMFFSDREGQKNQLYSIDKSGHDLRRISPKDGFTEEAVWMQK